MNILDSHGAADERVLVYETNTLFDEIGSFRVLQFADDAVQGAIDLQQPDRILFEYPRALIHLIEHNSTKENNGGDDIFIIGHGIGTLSSYFADSNCVTAEISETVVKLSQQHFGWKGSPILIGDGRLLLEQEQRLFDCIVLDAFTSKGNPQHLSTVQFFDMARAKLKRQGTLLINVTNKGKLDVRSNAIYNTLQVVFPHTYAFTLQAAEERDIRNSILIGSNHPIRYRLRNMAGFVPYHPESGYVMYD